MKWLRSKVEWLDYMWGSGKWGAEHFVCSVIGHPHIRCLPDYMDDEWGVMLGRECLCMAYGHAWPKVRAR